MELTLQGCNEGGLGSCVENTWLTHVGVASTMMPATALNHHYYYCKSLTVAIVFFYPYLFHFGSVLTLALLIICFCVSSNWLGTLWPLQIVCFNRTECSSVL
jgi:hypothetical protein